MKGMLPVECKHNGEITTLQLIDVCIDALSVDKTHSVHDTLTDGDRPLTYGELLKALVKSKSEIQRIYDLYKSSQSSALGYY